MEREWKQQRKIRPRLTSAPTWLSALVSYSQLINKRFEMHPHYKNDFDLNDVLTEEEAVHYCVPLRARDQTVFAVSNSDLWVSVIEPLKTNMHLMAEGWTTDFKHMHKKYWVQWIKDLERAEKRCSPSLLVESLCKFLLALKPENLYATIGRESTRDQLIQSIKAQTIEASRSSIEASPLRCCCCYTFMKPSEVKRLVTDSVEERQAAHGRFAKRTSRKSHRPVVRMREDGTVEGSQPQPDEREEEEAKKPAEEQKEEPTKEAPNKEVPLDDSVSKPLEDSVSKPLDNSRPKLLDDSEAEPVRQLSEYEKKREEKVS